MALPAIAAAAGALALRELATEGGGAAGRGLVGAAGRGFCNVHANNPGIVGSLGSIASDFVDGACKPYYDENGIEPPSGGPTFQGGQCVGVVYNVFYRVYSSVNGWAVGAVSGYGPIRGLSFSPSHPGYSGVYLDAHESDGSSPAQFFASYVQDENIPSVAIVNVVRLDGQPDDCGNPPSPFSPSSNAPPASYGVPFLGQDSKGRPAPITIFAPSLNPDGSLSIPVNIDGTPADLGNPSPLPGGGKPEDNAPVEPGDAKEPSPEDGGKVCFDAVEGKELVGVSWTLTVPEAFGEIPGSLVPVYPRVIGNIRLILGACDTVLGVVQDQVQIRTAKGSLFRPFGGTQVAGAIINTLPGVGVSLTPLYVSVEDE